MTAVKGTMGSKKRGASSSGGGGGGGEARWTDGSARCVDDEGDGKRVDSENGQEDVGEVQIEQEGRQRRRRR